MRYHVSRRRSQHLFLERLAGQAIPHCKRGVLVKDLTRLRARSAQTPCNTPENNLTNKLWGYKMYLIRKKNAKTAHIWTGYDTACRMYSTGGLRKKVYKPVSASDLPICTMCENKKMVMP